MDNKAFEEMAQFPPTLCPSTRKHAGRIYDEYQQADQDRPNLTYRISQIAPPAKQARRE